jgi:hypothetical protein
MNQNFDLALCYGLVVIAAREITFPPVLGGHMFIACSEDKNGIEKHDIAI